MRGFHFLDSGDKFFLIELKESSIIHVIAIFEREGGDEHQSDIKKVDFVAVAVIYAGETVLMDEADFFWS